MDRSIFDKTDSAPTPCKMGACAACCGMNELSAKCRGAVKCVKGDPEMRRRLLEMGFCNGTMVTLIRRAPLGDPIEFSIRGYHVSLRSQQAMGVIVTPE